MVTTNDENVHFQIKSGMNTMRRVFEADCEHSSFSWFFKPSTRVFRSFQEKVSFLSTGMKFPFVGQGEIPILKKTHSWKNNRLFRHTSRKESYAPTVQRFSGKHPHYRCIRGGSIGREGNPEGQPRVKSNAHNGGVSFSVLPPDAHPPHRRTAGRAESFLLPE